MLLTDLPPDVLYLVFELLGVISLTRTAASCSLLSCKGSVVGATGVLAEGLAGSDIAGLIGAKGGLAAS